MIPRLAELNRVLVAIRQLAKDDKGASKAAVIEYCSSVVMEGRLPDHESSIEFAKTLGLVVALEHERLLYTEAGDVFISLNPDGLYELSEDQKRLLARNQYLGGVLRRPCRTFFSAFELSAKAGAHRWSEYDGVALEDPGWLESHLVELGVIGREADALTVTGQFAEAVASFVEESEGMTEEHLKEILRGNEEVGDLAERLAFKFERSRLATAGHVVESECVRRVSKVRVNAGFDLESFDGTSPTSLYDRFIEVKGSRGKELRFIWTENEMGVAKRLGERYWIYYLGGVSIKTGVASQQMMLFQNPLVSILENANLVKTPKGLIVTAAEKV